MKILIINGSPKKRGLISQMLDIMRVEAENRGDSVELVYTNDLSVKPCIGCMVCRTKNKCVLGEDDSQRMIAKFQEADAIIMGAPCYWGNIPGKTATVSQRIAMVIQDGDYLTAGVWTVIVILIAFVFIFLMNLISGKAMKSVKRW